MPLPMPSGKSWKHIFPPFTSAPWFHMFFFAAPDCRISYLPWRETQNFMAPPPRFDHWKSPVSNNLRIRCLRGESMGKSRILSQESNGDDWLMTTNWTRHTGLGEIWTWAGSKPKSFIEQLLHGPPSDWFPALSFWIVSPKRKRKTRIGVLKTRRVSANSSRDHGEFVVNS